MFGSAMKFVSALAALLVTLTGAFMVFFGFWIRNTGQIIMGAVFLLVSIFLWFDTFSPGKRRRKHVAL
jgi:hypothetical protein